MKMIIGKSVIDQHRAKVLTGSAEAQLVRKTSLFLTSAVLAERDVPFI